jgi:hypothetical protein
MPEDLGIAWASKSAKTMLSNQAPEHRLTRALKRPQRIHGFFNFNNHWLPASQFVDHKIVV